MKIAAATDDGTTISRHFGKARFYVVLEVDGRTVVGQEQRAKPAHDHGHHHHGEHHHGGQGRPSGEGGGLPILPLQPPGQQANDGNEHHRMAAVIADCDVLLVRGMGRPAYHDLVEIGIQPQITDIETIDEAVRAFLDGALVNHTERLH